jgi:predicted amidohydrolase
VSEVTVACCQLALRIGEPAANRAACRAAVREAATRGARIIVLPELANSGYVFDDAAEARHLAESVEGGETVADWLALARELRVTLVGGLCESGTAGGAPHNSSVILDESGVRAVYRKVHLWDRETEVFAPGSEPAPVIQTGLGRISTMVCYDVEFPEWVRMAALRGAELLCVPTNWPRAPVPAGERPLDVVRVQAAASVNRLFIAACDRAGTERGVDWVGGTVIVGPDGYPLAGPVCADRTVTILAPLRPSEASRKELGPRNDVLADRRPQLYRL